MKIKTLVCLLTTLIVTGCANPNDIDLSKFEKSCAQKCSANFSACLSAFTLFPIQQNSQCNSGLKSCTQTCGPSIESNGSSSQTHAKSMEQAKKSCIELGFKVETESFGQCVLRVTKE